MSLDFGRIAEMPELSRAQLQAGASNPPQISIDPTSLSLLYSRQDISHVPQYLTTCPIQFTIRDCIQAFDESSHGSADGTVAKKTMVRCVTTVQISFCRPAYVNSTRLSVLRPHFADGPTACSKCPRPNRSSPDPNSGGRQRPRHHNLTLDEFRNSFIWNELALRRLASQNIKVTPAELNERMEFEFGERIQIRQIVFDSMQQAQKIQAQAAANPANFERLAKEFSIDQVSRPMGGLITHAVRRNAGFPELENLVFSLKQGEVSRVLPVADKFVVFRCEKILPAEQIVPEQLPSVHERLVDQISNEKLNAEASKLFKRLEKETKIVNVMNNPELLVSVLEC